MAGESNRGQEDASHWTVAPVAALSRPPALYSSQLMPLADGAMLLLLNGGHGAKRTYVYTPDSGRLVNRRLPLSKPTQIILAPPGRVLLIQQRPGAQTACFALWDPVTGEAHQFEGAMPAGTTVSADVYDEKMVMVANRNTSGSAAGFEWSDDDTFSAVLDLREGGFSVPFHGVEPMDTKALAMVDATFCFLLGHGRSSDFCHLRRADVLSPQPRPPARLGDHDADLATPRGLYKLRYAGRDAAGGVLVFGSAYTGDGSGLARWSIERPRFETVGQWAGPRGDFECATTLADGTTLVFWRGYDERQTWVRRYVPGEAATAAGRLPGHDSVCCAGQGTDGRIYLFTSEPYLDAAGQATKRPAKRLSVLSR